MVSRKKIKRLSVKESVVSSYLKNTMDQTLYDENMKILLTSGKRYQGRDNFECFCSDNILITKDPRDLVFRREFIDSYMKYGQEKGVQRTSNSIDIANSIEIANSTDIGIHLGTAGIGVKRMGRRYNFEWTYQGMCWLDPTNKTLYELPARRKKPLLDDVSRKQQKLQENKIIKEKNKTEQEEKKMKEKLDNSVMESEAESHRSKEVPDVSDSRTIKVHDGSQGDAAASSSTLTTQPEVQPVQVTDNDLDSLLNYYIKDFNGSSEATGKSVKQQELERFIDELLFSDKPTQPVQETTSPLSLETKAESFILYNTNMDVDDWEKNQELDLDSLVYNPVVEGIPSEDIIPQDILFENILPQDIPYQNILPQDIPSKNILPQDIPYENILPQDIPSENILHQDIPSKDSLTQDIPSEGSLTQNILPQAIPRQEDMFGEVVTLNNLPTPTFTEEKNEIYDEIFTFWEVSRKFSLEIFYIFFFNERNYLSWGDWNNNSILKFVSMKNAASVL